MGMRLNSTGAYTGLLYGVDEMGEPARIIDFPGFIRQPDLAAPSDDFDDLLG
jgi:hypothetical protein